MPLKSILLPLFAVLLVAFRLQAQCGDPKSLIALATNETYFCEGTEKVIIDNRCDEVPGNAGCIAFMVLDWGDGDIDTLAANDFANKEHLYNFPDSIACLLPSSGKLFMIRLEVVFQNDRRNGATQEVFIEPKPRAFCSASPVALCLDPTETVQFSGSQSCHEKTYFWDFGDGTTSTLANPFHEYSIPKNYNVRLIVENDCGKDTCNMTISAQSAVTASGNIDDTDVCVPDTITLSTTVLATQYEWILSPAPPNGLEFVPGFTRNSKITKLIVTKPGTYTVRLKVTGACNSDEKAIGTIEARAKPIVNLTGIPEGGCLPNFVMRPVATVVNNNNSSFVNYAWQFPGGNPPTSTVANPTVTYNTTGVFPIVLTVSADCGPTTYRDTVSIQNEAVVNVVPSGIPANNCGPFTVDFINNSSGAGAFLWTVSPSTGWQFEPGFGKDSIHARIRFLQAGNYTVTLALLQAPCGANKTWTGNIVVKGPPAGALADIPKEGGCLPNFQLRPTINISNNGNGSGLSYAWEFPGGNPSSSNQAAPTVTYSTAGLFPIKLTLSNGDCGASILLDTVFVRVEAKPVVNFSGVPTNNCGPFTVLFQNQSEGAGRYKWSISPQNGAVFESGSTEDSISPGIRFEKAGEYTVTLELLDAPCGNNKTWSTTITVKTAPTALLDSIPNQCVPIGITPVLGTFDNGNDPNATFSWAAPGSDKPTSTIFDPGTFQYSNADIYNLTFIVKNACSSDTTTADFTLSSPQALLFMPHPDSVCANGPPIPIVPNITPGDWQGNVSNGQFDTDKSMPGWNLFTYTTFRGSSCENKLSDSIFVVSYTVEAGADRSVCDTIGTFMLGGLTGNGVWRGPGLLDSLLGVVSLSALGLGIETYRYRVTVSQLGCIFSDTVNLTIRPKPVARPQVPLQACLELPVLYQSDSTGVDTYFWDLGNGQTSIQKDPMPIFSSAGFFTGYLIVENTAKCSDTTNFSLQIVAPPVLKLDLSRREICGPDSIFISGANTQGVDVQFSWVLGNGDSSSAAVPGAAFYRAGVEDSLYFITLSAGSACPTRSITDTLLVHPPPGVQLTAKTDTVCSGASTLFSVLLTGKPTEYLFTSGNGTTRNTLPLPSVSYFADTAFIRYQAVFWAKNQCGERRDTAEILAVPALARAFPNFSKETLCVGEPLYVENGATPFGVRVRYVFDDGFTTEEPNPTHAFNTPGRHSILQYASTGCGYDSIIRYVQVLPIPSAGFKMPDYTCVGIGLPLMLTVDTNGRVFRWYWPVDSSRTLNPSPVFDSAGVYPITLRVEDAITHCTAEITQSALVRPNPTAAYTPSDTTACGVLKTSLTPAVTQGIQHQWTASNGELAVGSAPVFTFRDSGLYWIRYTATDLFGCKDDTLMQKFRVWPVPSSDFTLDKNFTCGLPATVRYSPNTKGATGFEWVFHDGTTTLENTPTKTYTAEGIYTVQLIARNRFLCADTAARPFYAYTQPIAEFDIVDPSNCQFEPLGIANTSRYANHFFWQIGPYSSTLDTPHIAIDIPGRYDIRLIAARDSICFDTMFLKNAVTIHPAPVAGFYVRDSMPNGYAQGALFIFSTAQGATRYWYDLDNGDTATIANPFVRYPQNGVRNLVQVVTNAFGCRDTARLSVQVTPFGALFAPNAFAPGIDETGEYNYFIVKGVGLKSYSIKVYAPFGQLVWFSEELTDGRPTGRWDGKLPNGNLCPQGAYAWVIEGEFEGQASNPESIDYGSKKILQTGSVTLIR